MPILNVNHVSLLITSAMPSRWNSIRTMCDYNKKVSLCLELTANIPNELEQERWFGEPVKCCVLPTSIFLTNKKGFPVLSRAHQQLVKKVFKVRRDNY